mgnify:CR=1 FL=1
MKILLAFLILFTIPAFADDHVKEDQKKERSKGGGGCGG